MDGAGSKLRRRKKSRRKTAPRSVHRVATLDAMLEHAVIFDTETTGLNHKSGSVLQLAGIRVRHGAIQRGETFAEFVQYRGLLPPEITALTNIHEHHVRKAPPEWLVISQFAHFVGDAVLIAHNAPFDVRFLEECVRNEAGRWAGLKQNEFVDSLAYFRSFYGNVRGVSLRLSLIAETLEVETPADLHRATADVDLLARCLIDFNHRFGRRLELQAKSHLLELPSTAMR